MPENVITKSNTVDGFIFKHGPRVDSNQLAHWESMHCMVAIIQLFQMILKRYVTAKLLNV